MSIQSEIDRIKAAKADAKAALIERGVDPGDATIDEYGNQIRAIPTGVTSFNGRTGAVTPQAGDYTADMVGARPDTWMPTADEVGAVPATRTVNGKPLSENIALDAADVGARAASWMPTAAEVEARPDSWTPTAAEVGAIPAVSGVKGQFLGFTAANTVGAVDAPASGGKRTCRFVVGTSTAGWTAADCDYLCDGTDDQVEINAAIQALPSGGGEIVILDGTYNIAATIAMNKDNVKLSGNGNATVLRRMWDSKNWEGVVTITAVNGNCCISDLFIDGNKSIYNSSSDCGIYLFGSSNNTITNITCNNNYSAIFQHKNSGGNIITGNICNNNSNRAIYLYQSEDNTIITNNICNNNYNGISLSADSKNGNTVTGNICNNNNDSGIYVSSEHHTITGNTCCNNGRGIYASSASFTTITGNICYNNERGIYLASLDHSLVSDNTCLRNYYTSSQHTIYLYGNYNNYNLIANNNIMGKNYVSEGGTGNTFVNNKYN